jgi:Flp pilus assembly protein TadD
MADLNRQCQDPKAPASAFAQRGLMHVEDADHPNAAYDFRRASELDYGNVNYHLQLAAELIALGQRDDAAHEIEVAQRLDPNSERARTLLMEINAPRR